MAGTEDRYPEELRVLVVDDNLTCLRILELLLQRCKYKVTGTQEPTKALKMLTENPKKYDIVISDVHMPVMDGFQLLENIALHMDIPVIMLSANGDYTQVMKGITHGAVDYLIKPVRIEELRNIWQHVVRRKREDMKKGKTIAAEKEGGDQSEDGKMITDGGPDLQTRKRTDSDDDGDDVDGPKTDNCNPSDSKKQRVTWHPSLQKKFVNAVDELGLGRATPKKILDIMNVEGLTRDNVASHLQKYKVYLKRMTDTMAMGQFPYPSLTPFRAHNPYLFRSGGAIFNPYAPFTSLESPLPTSSMGLISSFQPSTMNEVVSERMTTPTRNLGGYIARIPGANQLQMNSNQVTIGGPSTRGVEGLPNQPPLPAQAQHLGCRPQSNNPNLQDQTKCVENRQSNNINQAPPTNFNGGVYSTEISHLQNVFEHVLMGSPGTPSGQYPYGGDLINVANTSIDNYQLNLGESSSNPCGAFVDPAHGHVVGVNNSSGLQNIEARTREADTVLNLDEEDYLIDNPDIFAGLHGNGNLTLTDIARELLD